MPFLSSSPASLLTRILSSSEPNHLLNEILAKIITFVDTIDASVLVAQMGYQLSTDAMILCSGTEEELREFHTRLESMRDISGNGQEISRFIRDGFRDIKQQIYEVRTQIEILVVIAQLFE